ERGFGVWEGGVGGGLGGRGKVDEAVKSYRDSLAIRERVAASDPSNTQWQGGLALSYGGIGDVLVVKGKLDEALKSYRDSLAIRERLAASDRSNTNWQRDLQLRVGKIDGLAGMLILARDFRRALEASDL